MRYPSLHILCRDHRFPTYHTLRAAAPFLTSRRFHREDLTRSVSGRRLRYARCNTGEPLEGYRQRRSREGGGRKVHRDVYRLSARLCFVKRTLRRRTRSCPGRFLARRQSGETSRERQRWRDSRFRHFQKIERARARFSQYTRTGHDVQDENVSAGEIRGIRPNSYSPVHFVAIIRIPCHSGGACTAMHHRPRDGYLSIETGIDAATAASIRQYT